MADAILYNKAYQFAIDVVKICQQLSNDKREYVLSRQLLRAGTSIAANISEANGAISKAEFSAKMSIAYKECRESQYWLNLLKDTGYIESQRHRQLLAQADEIGKILYAIIKTCRRK
jgi:four helix bundle protein